MGPDDVLYYTDFGSTTVYRSPAMGMRTAVNTTAIRQPNGLIVGTDGALYVVGYGDGTLHRFVLNNGMEMCKTTTTFEENDNYTRAPAGQAEDAG